MDTPKIQKETFKGIPQVDEIVYAKAIESYTYLVEHSNSGRTSFPMYELIKHLTILEEALQAIGYSIEVLPKVRNINVFPEFPNEQAANLQLVSRMDIDEEGKPKYILEHSPVEIEVLPRNNHAELFERDNQSLQRLRTSFRSILEHFRVIEK